MSPPGRRSQTADYLTRGTRAFKMRVPLPASPCGTRVSASLFPGEVLKTSKVPLTPEPHLFFGQISPCHLELCRLAQSTLWAHVPVEKSGNCQGNDCEHRFNPGGSGQLPK
jgi:hypothetical protein